MELTSLRNKIKTPTRRESNIESRSDTKCETKILPLNTKVMKPRNSLEGGGVE